MRESSSTERRIPVVQAGWPFLPFCFLPCPILEPWGLHPSTPATNHFLGLRFCVSFANPGPRASAGVTVGGVEGWDYENALDLVFAELSSVNITPTSARRI
jgi:hypothetical protein